MEIRTVHFILVAGISLLTACGRDAKTAAQLGRIEAQGEQTLKYDKTFFSRLKVHDEALEAINQNLEAISKQLAQHEKQDAAQAALNEGLLKRQEEMDRTLKAFVQDAATNHQAGQQKLDALKLEISAKKAPPQVRWAYVDKYKVQNATEDLFKNSPLSPEQDPTKNPELAQKLSEYQSLQQKYYLFGRGMRPMSYPARPGEPQAKEYSAEEMAAADIKMAGLSASLAVYFANQQQSTKTRDAAIAAAFREFSKDRFDLLLDKTFGDHEIYYKSDAPVPDVTNQIIEFMRSTSKKK